MALNERPVIDEDALRKKISGESQFISGIINTIPPMSWQGGSESSDEEEETDVSSRNDDLEVSKGEPSSESPRANNTGKQKSPGKQAQTKNHTAKKFSENKLDRWKSEKEEHKQHKQSKPPEQMKAGFSSEGKMVFSKFDFSEMGSYVEEKKKKVCNDPRRILEKLKERQELIQKLKAEGNEEKALKLKEKDGWNKAFSKVQGLKVRDDPEQLKETIYKQDLRKSKHKKLWGNRDEKVKKAIEYKVIKRETNIKAKRDLKLKHRLKKALKKGRVIPGFS